MLQLSEGMWSLEQESNPNTAGSNYNSNNNNITANNRVLSSSSSRSSPSCTSSILHPQTPRRTMEEVWKDITLTTLQERPMTPFDGQHLHHHRRQAAAAVPSFRGMILQDFLAGSPSCRPLPPPPPPPGLPPTALSLSSTLEFQHMGADRHAAVQYANSNSSSNGRNASIGSSAFSSDAMVGPPSPAGLFSLCPKKRESPDITGDRRHKRMIKNRESAARSRARKQAYTNELELEVATLVKENARLRKQYDELRLAMVAQAPKFKILQRSSTSPF